MNNPLSLYLARLSPASRRVQKLALQDFENTLDCELDWQQVGLGHVSAYWELSPNSRATRMRAMMAVQGILRIAGELGVVPARRYLCVNAVTGRGRAVSKVDTERLLQACRDSGTWQGARDAAFLALGLGAGLRSHEILKMDNWDTRELPLGVKTFAVTASMCGPAPKPYRLHFPLIRNARGAALTAPEANRMLRLRSVQAAVEDVKAVDFVPTFWLTFGGC